MSFVSSTARAARSTRPIRARFTRKQSKILGDLYRQEHESKFREQEEEERAALARQEEEERQRKEVSNRTSASFCDTTLSNAKC